MAEKQLYPVKYPTKGSKLCSLARCLVGSAGGFAGKIPVDFIYDRHSEMRDQDWLATGIYQLRTKYSYFCRLHRGFVICALEWPLCHKVQQWTGRSYVMEDGPVVVFDPRLHAQPLKYKYRLSEDGTDVDSIRTYVLRHRAPRTHILDCKWLFDKWGSRKVLRVFAILNTHHGFHLRKLNPGKPDGLWIVDRDRNVQLSSEVVEDAFKKLERDGDED